jgi:hypothetical protein
MERIFLCATTAPFYTYRLGHAKELMFLLLAVACSLYFILGEVSEGIN